MTARLVFTNAMRRLQAEAAAKALSKGWIKLRDEEGNVLAEFAIGEKFAVGTKGERIAFDPLKKARIAIKGRPATCEFVANDARTVLGHGLAGSHDGAVLKFADAMLYEGMVVEFDEPLLLDLPVTKEV